MHVSLQLDAGTQSTTAQQPDSTVKQSLVSQLETSTAPLGHRKVVGQQTLSSTPESQALAAIAAMSVAQKIERDIGATQ